MFTYILDYLHIDFIIDNVSNDVLNDVVSIRDESDLLKSTK